MYLHKTTGMAAGTPAGNPEPPVRNAATKAPPPQATQPSASTSPAAPRSTSALVAAAGLPADKLSASIVSFARFFSLPLKPELLAAMRRQAFAISPATMTQTDAAKTAKAEIAATKNGADSSAATKNREALSLAAAAVESKGVELHPKGLETFAEVIDPDWRKRQDSDGRDQRERRNKNHQQEEENAPGKTGPITAAGLKQMTLESAEKDPLLALLNRLPGKNGQRWVVLPFNFCEDGREFSVSMRVLLETDQAANRAARMTATKVAIDVAESGLNGKPEARRRWLFALEAAAGLLASRLTVYLQPELPPRAHPALIRELSHLLKIPPERISVKNGEATFPCESGGTDDLLFSINEAV